jgi:membrane-bound inhibitor of C-type lysozyme
MPISFTRVTWYSQTIAIILFVAVFFLGFYLGRGIIEPTKQSPTTTPVATIATSTLITGVTFICPNHSYISAMFYRDGVKLLLSDGRTETLPHALSADGARYANSDESFVFWNKGNGAFITEQGTTTYSGCETK